MKDGINHVLQPDKNSLVDYRAKLFEMNAKPDSKSKVFEKKVLIDINNISDLYRDINHKLKSYENGDNIGITTQVIIDYEKNKSFSFTSWDSFKLEKHREASAIMSITLVWECNIKFKQYEHPQRHKIVVKLINNMSKTEILNLILTGNLEDSGPINTKIGPVIARIDFVDYLFAEEIINLIEGWNNCLDSPNYLKKNIMLFLKSKRRWVSYITVYLTTFLAVIVGVNLLIAQMNSKNLQFVSELEISTITSWFKIIIYTTILLLIFYKIMDYLGSIIFSQLDSYGKYHMFNISRGDEILNDEIQKREKSTVFGILLKIFGAFILNLIASFVFFYIQNNMN